jgi:hypothetical protein
MTIIYSIFSLITNLIASNLYSIDHPTAISKLKSDVSYISLSLGSKQLNPTIEN